MANFGTSMFGGRFGRKAAVLAASLALTASLAGASALSMTSAGAATPPVSHYIPLGPGYSMVASDGGVFSFGQSQFYGSTGALILNKPIVGGAENPFLEGYWLVASDGGIFAFGSSHFYGSTGSLHLNKPIVGMAAVPTGLGYWLVASDGGIFAFGDAPFFGSTGSLALNKPIVGMASTPDGHGYWLVASDGGIFSFGDAAFYGSLGSLALNKPIVGMASTPDGHGYWLVASDGGIFALGDARFYGSTGSLTLNKPIVGMASTPTGGGYWLVASDGGIFAFGNAGFYGSTGSMTLNKPIVGMATRPPFAVKVDPYVPASGQTSDWVDTGSGWQLQLDNATGGPTPTGARVLGVEGLDVSQLQTIGFTMAGGNCNSNPYYLLTARNPATGVIDDRTYACSAGLSGSTVSFNPVAGATGAAPLPANDVVQSLDIEKTNAGPTVALTNITVAGLTITDYRTFTDAGTIIG